MATAISSSTSRSRSRRARSCVCSGEMAQARARLSKPSRVSFPRARDASPCAAGNWPHSRRSASRAWESATCLKSGASSATSRSARTSKSLARPGRTDATWTADRVFELFPHLRGLADRQAGRLSGGEQQMLTIARTLMGSPHVLLLDEPSEGLAPLVVQMLGEQLGGSQADRSDDGPRRAERPLRERAR